MFENLRAARLMGRADRLHQRGERQQAQELLRQALDLALRPNLNHSSPINSSLITTCTQQAVKIADELGRPEEGRVPLQKALEALCLTEARPADQSELSKWGTWARARLEALNSDAQN